MPYELRTEIEIAAPAERVWALLTDFARYPSWNPFVVGIEGALALGAPLTIQLQPAGSTRPMTIKPSVTALEPGRSFAWTGKLFASFVFTGTHGFEVIALGPERTKLVHGERFSGVLVPVLKKMLDGPTRASFVAMNEALKAKAEAAA